MTNASFVPFVLLLAQAGAASTVHAATTPPPSATSAPGALMPLPQIVQQIQQRYDGAADFRARFTQTYTSSATGRERSSTGEVLVKKPGRMRWNYEQPEPQIYLASGSTFWVYEPDAKQAFKQDLRSSQLPAALSFLTGKGKLSDDFEITVAKELPYGAPGDYKLALKPKQPQTTYKAIYFVVDAKSFLVRQSVLLYVQGDVNAFTFTDMQLNTKISDNVFKWAPPPGTKVIEGGKGP